MNKKTAKKEETPTVEKEVKQYGSYLQNKILKVKPIEAGVKWTGLLVAGQERKKAPFLFNKVKRSFQVPLNSAALGGGVKVILDNQKRKLIKKYETSYPDGMTEQEFFEQELGVDLNPYLKKEDNFWRNHKNGRVRLTREAMTLNLNMTLDMLRYKILMANSRYIASSYEERKNSQSFQFMIVDENKLTSMRLEEADLKARAMVRFTEVTRSEKEMIGVIKALGRTLPANYDERWLKAEVLNELERGDKSFLDIVDDPLFKDKIFVQEAVNARAIVKVNRNRYKTDGGVELGDLSSTISWLNNPDNQEARLRIKSLIELAEKE